MVLHEILQGIQPIHFFIDSVVDQIVSQGGQSLFELLDPVQGELSLL
jgi:hypothetical protein